MAYMFNNCHKLKVIKGLNKLKTSEVTTMNEMFCCCKELEELDLTNFDTSKVTNMAFMFNNCHKLKIIKGLNKLKTSEVITMNEMFCYCKELEELDLTNFDTSKVTNMAHMFFKCNKLKIIKG